MEIGVAATKTFTAQILTLYMLGIYVARLKKLIDVETSRHIITSMKSVPGLLSHFSTTLATSRKLRLEFAKRIAAISSGVGLAIPSRLKAHLR